MPDLATLKDIATVLVPVLALFGVIATIYSQRQTAALQARASSLAKFRQDWINDVRKLIKEMLLEIDKLRVLKTNAREVNSKVVELEGKILEKNEKLRELAQSDAKLSMPQITVILHERVVPTKDLIAEKLAALKEKKAPLDEQLKELKRQIVEADARVYSSSILFALYLNPKKHSSGKQEAIWLEKLNPVIDLVRRTKFEDMPDSDPNFDKLVKDFVTFSRYRLKAEWEQVKRDLDISASKKAGKKDDEDPEKGEVENETLPG